jgi:hypothetical protein
MNQNLESLTIKEELNKIKDRITPPEPITLDQVREVLDLTIKKDDGNKIITFLAMLAAYTDNAQFNISFNAPSSSGKSFISPLSSRGCDETCRRITHLISP